MKEAISESGMGNHYNNGIPEDMKKQQHDGGHENNVKIKSYKTASAA